MPGCFISGGGKRLVTIARSAKEHTGLDYSRCGINSARTSMVGGPSATCDLSGERAQTSLGMMEKPADSGSRLQEAGRASLGISPDPL